MNTFLLYNVNNNTLEEVYKKTVQVHEHKTSLEMFDLYGYWDEYIIYKQILLKQLLVNEYVFVCSTNEKSSVNTLNSIFKLIAENEKCKRHITVVLNKSDLLDRLNSSKYEAITKLTVQENCAWIKELSVDVLETSALLNTGIQE